MTRVLLLGLVHLSVMTRLPSWTSTVPEAEVVANNALQLTCMGGYSRHDVVEDSP